MDANPSRDSPDMITEPSHSVACAVNWPICKFFIFIIVQPEIVSVDDHEL